MRTFEQKLLPGFSQNLDQINKELSGLKLDSVPEGFVTEMGTQRDTIGDRRFFFETARNLKGSVINELSCHPSFTKKDVSWFEAAALADPIHILVTFANNYSPNGGHWRLCVAAVTSTIHKSASISEEAKEALIGAIHDFYIAIPTDFNVEEINKIGLTKRETASKLSDALGEYFSLRDLSYNPRSTASFSPNKPR